MPKEDIYVYCDELEKLPQQHRENWFHEITLLRQILPREAAVLQVGCMDGTRILALLKERPEWGGKITETPLGYFCVM